MRLRCRMPWAGCRVLLSVWVARLCLFLVLMWRLLAAKHRSMHGFTHGSKHGSSLAPRVTLCAGVMADLSPEEAVALLSALVFQEKSDAEPVLPPSLAAATEQLAAIAHQAGVAQAEAGLPLHPEEFARSVLKFGLVEVRRHGTRARLTP